MLPDETRHVLIHTLAEMQSRIEYLASSVIADRDFESTADLRSAGEFIERVVERMRLGDDVGLGD
jgi:hypothetical protein